MREEGGVYCEGGGRGIFVGGGGAYCEGGRDIL